MDARIGGGKKVVSRASNLCALKKHMRTWAVAPCDTKLVLWTEDICLAPVGMDEARRKLGLATQGKLLHDLLEPRLRKANPHAPIDKPESKNSQQPRRHYQHCMFDVEKGLRVPQSQYVNSLPGEPVWVQGSQQGNQAVDRTLFVDTLKVTPAHMAAASSTAFSKILKGRAEIKSQARNKTDQHGLAFPQKRGATGHL